MTKSGQVEIKENWKVIYIVYQAERVVILSYGMYTVYF